MILASLSFGSYANALTDDETDAKPNIYISDIPPWMEGEAGSCHKGIICDFFNRLLQYSSIEADFVYTSLSRANEKFYTGEQFVSLFPFDDSFKSKYHLIGEVFTYDVGLLTLDENREFDATQDEVCITRNNPHKVDGYIYIEVNAYEQCFEMLERKRVKYMLVTNLEFEYHNADAHLRDKFSFQKIYSIPLWLYLNIEHDENSSIFKEIMKSYEIVKQDYK